MAAPDLPSVPPRLASPRLFVSDCDPAVVYRVRSDGGLTRFEGTPAAERVAADDPPATVATLRCPLGLVFGGPGVLYVADAHNSAVRVVDRSGVARRVGAAPGSRVDRQGLALRALLRSHDAVALGLDRTVYVSDTDNSRVRRLDPSGRLTLLSGAAEQRLSDARDGDVEPARRAQLAVDARGAVYFADSNSNRVLRVDTEHLVTVVAGNGDAAHTGDGGLAVRAGLADPRGVAFDRLGRLYVSEGTGRRVRRIDRAGVITTVAGSGAEGMSGDGGPATAATFRQPDDIAVDSEGALYVVDPGAGTVRRVAPDGTISTLGR